MNWNRILLGVFLFSAFACGSAFAQTIRSPAQRLILNLINEERTKAGVHELKWNDQLGQSALSHARRMVEEGQLGHQLAEEPELGDRIRSTGLRFDAWGENVAAAGNPEEIHQALMNSPPHRANILDPKYNAVGIALLSHGRDLYAVENFATVYPALSETQFWNAIVTAFNETRKAKRFSIVGARADLRLKQAACSETSDLNVVFHGEPGAKNVIIFSSSSPEKLPPDMLEVASDPSLVHMNLGVCFRPGKEQGYASFRVVAAFYPALRN